MMSWLAVLLLAWFAEMAGGQRVTSVSQVKSLFIDSFSGGPEASALRDSLVRHLARSRFRLVSSRNDADAVINGRGQVWVRGFITTNSRSPALNRQAVFAGYLSLEMVDPDGQPLWSWLVTPGKLVWNNIVDDLAARGARKLVEAADTTPSPSTASAPSDALRPTTLVGAGATFPAPLYQKWFEDFQQFHPNVRIRYSPEGSELGNKRLVAREIDFAGSDVAPEEVVDSAEASRLRRFATVLGAVVPIYNLGGVPHDIRFTSKILAGIYLGQITRWNDPEIQRWNKGIDLPNAEIVVVHRSDGSGTTWVWSDFLSKASSQWLSSVGRGTSPKWPVGRGVRGNDGVATAVNGTPNSIGYVELTFAIQNRLSFGSVQNPAGEFIRADLESVAEAAREVSSKLAMPSALTNAPGKSSYPIVSFTWLIVPADSGDETKQAAIAEILRWVLTSGQRDCSALGYVPLPRELAESQLGALAALSH
jgi:phosphate ABC transporter phosphate-binding protein